MNLSDLKRRCTATGAQIVVYNRFTANRLTEPMGVGVDAALLWTGLAAECAQVAL